MTHTTVTKYIIKRTSFTTDFGAKLEVIISTKNNDMTAKSYEVQCMMKSCGM